MNYLNNKILPVDVVFHPSWWFKNAGITFDEDFFFHPAKRVRSERKMEQVLYDHFGKYGLGANRDKDLPVVGAVHNAAGYLISEMLGCKLRFSDNAPPEVMTANRDSLEINQEAAFKSEMFKRFERLCDGLKKKYGYLIGDVNWSGVLNLALDVRGQSIFIDMLDKPEEVKKYFAGIANVMERFAKGIEAQTGSSSISVNNIVQHFDQPIFLHSECSVTMISAEQYDEFILPIDHQWSENFRPFGIHFCGNDPHRFAESFARLPHLDFLDVGWGGNLKVLRQHLPDTFLNIRLNPVGMDEKSPDEIRETITKLVNDSGNPRLTGVCCVNMDENVTDKQVTAIFDAVNDVRKEKVC